MMIDLSAGELNLLIEALAKTAARHESTSRFRPSSAGPHDRAAASMRQLRNRLLTQRSPNWQKATKHDHLSCRQIGRPDAVVAPSVQGGLWGIYGWGSWPSYCYWLIPGTLIEK